MKDAFIPSQTNNTDINLFSYPLEFALQTRALNPRQYRSIRRELAEIIILNPNRLSALKAST